MLLSPTLDNLLYNAQRQGKISFYVSFAGFVYRHLLTRFSDDSCKSVQLSHVDARVMLPVKYGEEAAIIGSAAALADDDEWASANSPAY